MTERLENIMECSSVVRTPSCLKQSVMIFPLLEFYVNRVRTLFLHMYLL